MRVRELNQHLRGIQEAIAFGDSLAAGAPERAIIARHVCVLVSGYIENVVRVTLTEFAARVRPRAELLSYIEASCDGFQNPNCQKILRIVGRFNPQWRVQLDAIDDGIKTAIESIVSNRHLIAHGRTSGMSLAQVKGYFAQVQDFANELSRIVR